MKKIGIYAQEEIAAGNYICRRIEINAITGKHCTIWKTGIKIGVDRINNNDNVARETRDERRDDLSKALYRPPF